MQLLWFQFFCPFLPAKNLPQGKLFHKTAKKMYYWILFLCFSTFCISSFRSITSNFEPVKVESHEEKSTFKVLFCLRRNKQKKDGTMPVMCRITVNGAISQFSCKLDADPAIWDTKGSRVSGKSKIAKELIEQLQNDLDAWSFDYNTNRTHSGKFCCGKKPVQTFIESMDIAKDHYLEALPQTNHPIPADISKNLGDGGDDGKYHNKSVLLNQISDKFYIPR